MGKEIEKIALNRGHKIGLIVDLSNREDLNPETLKDIDVAIEFSHPDSAAQNIISCFDSGVSVVSGTTGWLSDLGKVNAICNNNELAFFHATNFSPGMNIMFMLNQSLARVMEKFSSYEVSISETHHIHKLDSPSGTAITLAESIIKNSSRKNNWIMDSDQRSGSSIPVVSRRVSEVPGEHTVLWESGEDKIQIKHEAKNRQGFALGAVLAAEFINGEKGIFGMKELLGL
jgi:4-hydroxy-tetrahydrodipicolinate reductase